MGLRRGARDARGDSASHTRAHCVFCCDDAGPVRWTAQHAASSKMGTREPVQDAVCIIAASARLASEQQSAPRRPGAQDTPENRTGAFSRTCRKPRVRQGSHSDLLHASQLLPPRRRRRARSSIGWADIRRPSVLTPTREAVAIRLAGLLRALHGHGPAHAGRSG